MDLWSLLDLCTPWCVHVVATLRVADHMAGGLTQIDDLSAASHCDAESLARVLRHLIGKGLFEEPTPGHFALNEAARALLEPGMRSGLDLGGIGGRMAGAWCSLLAAVQTGKPAYQRIFGRPFWEDLESNPAVGASFDELMGPGGHGAPDPELPLSRGWDGVKTIVDVGGGTGAYLAAVLREHPGARGILVDLPRAVAQSAAFFQQAGVAGRATAVGQSFFDPLPANGDVYVLRKVLGDWPDRESTSILARCAEAARPDGSVVVMGGVSGEEPPAPELLMLVLLGGKSRSPREFQSLAAAAGLKVVASGRTRSDRYFVECQPA